VIKPHHSIFGAFKQSLSQAEPKRRSFGLLAHLRHDWAALVGLIIILTLILLALFAPLIAPYDPFKTVPAERLQAPGVAHWLGTDELGRDTFSRLLWGARLSLGMVTIAALSTMVIGVMVGAVAGYFGGWLDDVLMRIVDILLAFPGLILALAIVGMLGPGIENVVLGFVAVWWVSYARVTRSLVLSLRERDFIEATRSVGASNWRIILRHILPNVLPPVIVLITLEMGRLLLAISGLSFLGLGAQPPTPEWGAMLNAGRRLLQRAPELMIYPGLAISLAVMGFNLLGDGLRDALDPHLKV
jgi:peptide/nickel transport system permease protein